MNRTGQNQRRWSRLSIFGEQEHPPLLREITSCGRAIQVKIDLLYSQHNADTRKKGAAEVLKTTISILAWCQPPLFTASETSDLLRPELIILLILTDEVSGLPFLSESESYKVWTSCLRFNTKMTTSLKKYDEHSNPASRLIGWL